LWLESLGEESRGGMRKRPSKPIMCAMMSVFVWTGLVGLFAPSGMADDTLASFKGGIGVIPVSSGVGTAATSEVVNRNIIRGVQPGVNVWTIADLTAEVRAGGHIEGNGRGLAVASGDTVGTALALTPTGGTAELDVFATLICENVAPFVERNTNPVPIAANGDFRIDDV
jgi:hypothetical protein